MKRTIKINFADFWSDFNPNDNFIINVLRKQYDVDVVDKPDYLFFSAL